MKKSDEEYKKWLDQLDPFDPNNWKYLKDRPLPQMKLDFPLELVFEDRPLDVNDKPISGEIVEKLKNKD